MGVDVEDFKDKACRFLSRFFSLIIAVLNLISSLIMIIGCIKFLSTQGTFYRTEVAHFIATVVATAASCGYLSLHFLPKKRYRVLYGLGGLLVVSIFLSAHSFGLVAPTVDDCDEKGLLLGQELLNQTFRDVQDAQSSFTWNNVTNSIHGRLGQSLGNCVDSEIIFAGTFMQVIFHIVSAFDVQRMLAARIKSKTYGERFVEMGIR